MQNRELHPLAERVPGSHLETATQAAVVASAYAVDEDGWLVITVVVKFSEDTMP